MDYEKISGRLCFRHFQQLRRIDKKEQQKIVVAAESLADDPRPFGYKKLVEADGLYRIKVGRYRIIYEIFDDILFVTVLRLQSAMNGHIDSELRLRGCAVTRAQRN